MRKGAQRGTAQKTTTKQQKTYQEKDDFERDEKERKLREHKFSAKQTFRTTRFESVSRLRFHRVRAVFAVHPIGHKLIEKTRKK